MDDVIIAVQIIDSTFDRNSPQIAAVHLNYASLNMSNVDISDHTLLIDGINPINTDLNGVIAHNTKEIELKQQI